MVRAEADGTAISARTPPAARAAVSSRRRATTSRRSKASSESGRGSSAPRDGRSTMAWAKAGRESAAEAPSAATSNGTDRQAAIARPVSRNVGLDERPGTPLARRGTVAGTARRCRVASRPRRPRRPPRREQRQQRPIERQRDPGAIARLPVRPERAAVAERGQPGEGQRQDPVARPPAGVRDEPDATGVMLEARARTTG